MKTDKKPGFSKCIFMVKGLNPLLIQNPCSKNSVNRKKLMIELLTGFC
ncbi:Uncharacterized protein dnm_045960 [Desulfonema magnum]|uniref:Uncharacterized protein n=1 Tax=Desulfonema magnum TaxID=45655 RepID=A0A975BN73_9BACT|nr:Uncharacterized protein dnm_045960 [Desulfonema magnum]